MAKLVAKYHNIYLFIITLSIIGFITGFFYYQVQSNELKEEIINEVKIEETLSTGFNNIPKRLKMSFTVLLSSILILPVILNIFKIFSIPFEIGFIFNLLNKYSFKFISIYLGLYYIIPYFFTIILIRISISITISVIKYFLYKEKKNSLYLKNQILKFLIITGLFLFYEFMMMIFSYNINLYLMEIISS